MTSAHTKSKSPIAPPPASPTTIAARQHDSASRNPDPWFADDVDRSAIENALKHPKDLSHAMANPGAFWRYGHWIYGMDDDNFIEQLAKCAAKYEGSAKTGCAWTHRVALGFDATPSSKSIGTSQANLLYADTQTKASDHQATCNAWGACLQKAWSGRKGPQLPAKNRDKSQKPTQEPIALQFEFQSMYNEQSSAVGRSMEDDYRTMLDSTARVEKQSHRALEESLNHLNELGLDLSEFDVADYFEQTGVTIQKSDQAGDGENYTVKIAEYKEGMDLDPLKDLMSMINDKQNHAQSQRARRLAEKILEIRATP